MIPRVGESSAVRAYRRGLQAIDALEAIASRLGTDCEFVRRSALYLASDAVDVPKLQQECESRQHFGFDVNFLDSQALKTRCGLQGHGALQSRFNAELNPYRLTQSLVRFAQGNGLRVFDQTHIEALVDDGRRITLQGAKGQIEARHAVFATGYFTQSFLPHQDARLHTTYAIASQPLGEIPRWPDSCLLWETAHPYVYLRRTVDGRAMIGGGDTSGADDHENQRLLIDKARALKARFEQMFPETEFEPEYAWAGTFADTADGLPFIGRVPGHERIYLTLGYGGNGITFGMIAAELVRDLIQDRANPDEGVFRFNR